MAKHETPTQFDRLLKREGITAAEYYRSYGLDQRHFWQAYWSTGGDLVKVAKLGVEPEKPSYISWFSRLFSNFGDWLQHSTSKTTTYQKRITRYMESHPGATLQEARGHKPKRL